MKLIDKQLTIKLKEKGFTFELPIRYNGKGTYYHYVDPQISQVLKWLREDKRIGLWATPYFIDGYTFAWRWNVSYFEGEELFIPNIVDFDTYEDACIAGIEYVINNLI